MGLRAGGINHDAVTDIFVQTRRDQVELTLTFSIADDGGFGEAGGAATGESAHTQWINALRFKKDNGDNGDFIIDEKYNLATNNCQTYAQGALNYLKDLGPDVFTAAPWTTLTRRYGTMLDMDLLQLYEPVRNVAEIDTPHLASLASKRAMESIRS